MQKSALATDARRPAVLVARTLTRLQRGHVVRFSDGEHLITYVNDCRAVAVPRAKRGVTITPLFGEAVTFQRHASAQNISPNSECEIVGYDQEWLAEQAEREAQKGGGE
jgi:hypothetical protein